MYPSASQLRARSRAQLGDNIFGTKWLMMGVLGLVVSVAASIGSSIFIGAFLIPGIAGVGLAYASLCRIRTDEKVNVEELIYGCEKGRAVNTIILGILHDLLLALWTLLFFVPGIIKSYSYSQAYYISIYNPNMEHLDCITASRKMMDGHKWRLFCLDMSFLGWYIVGFLTLGIGLFWVYPYHQMARANFFEDLRTRSQQAAA